jgi:hypothetical protein
VGSTPTAAGIVYDFQAGRFINGEVLNIDGGQRTGAICGSRPAAHFELITGVSPRSDAGSGTERAEIRLTSVARRTLTN